MKLRDKSTDRLFDAILSLKNRDDCYAFFEDLCTVAELKALSQRLEVAQLLVQGVTYTDISLRTGASTATISRVNRALNYGADGYRKIIVRLEEEGNIDETS